MVDRTRARRCVHEIGGVPIAAGDRVTAWNPPASRDPSVFPDPDRFREDCTPNKPVS